jgi:ABC-2 type transport system permease protein
MQYRLDFMTLVAAHFCITGVEFLAMVGLFQRFGSIRGWLLPEVALLYGMASASLSLANSLASGFDSFGNTIRQGDFDRILVRPRSAVLQVAGEQLTLRRLGRFIQGVLVIIWSLSVLEVSWTPACVLLLPAAILGGACLFYGVFILQATLAFWTIESLEIMNVLSYGGASAAQYPVSIYQGLFRDLLLYLLPLGCMNYFPALALLGRSDPLGFPSWVPWASPLVGVLFLLISLKFFRFGIRHYQSTGS